MQHYVMYFGLWFTLLLCRVDKIIRTIQKFSFNKIYYFMFLKEEVFKAAFI